MPLGTEAGLGPGTIVLDWDPTPPPKGAQQPPTLFGPCLSRPKGRPSQQLLSSFEDKNVPVAYLALAVRSHAFTTVVHSSHAFLFVF